MKIMVAPGGIEPPTQGFSVHNAILLARPEDFLLTGVPLRLSISQGKSRRNLCIIPGWQSEHS